MIKGFFKVNSNCMQIIYRGAFGHVALFITKHVLTKDGSAFGILKNIMCEA